MANAHIPMILQTNAELLDSVLYEKNKSITPKRGEPQRYLFITEPQDLRVWRSGDDINLVCLTDNRAQTFWSFVAEMKEDETFMLQTKPWSRYPYLAEEYDRYTLAELPGGGNLTLQHAGLPQHFDTALIDAYGIPDYDTTSSASSHAVQRLKTVQKALEAQLLVDEDVLVSYDELRHSWAEPNGLFSNDFGPLNSSVLLTLLLAASIDKPSDQSLTRAFTSKYQTQSAIDAALGSSYPTAFLPADTALLVQSSYSINEQLQDTLLPAMKFKHKYRCFIELQYQSWDNLYGAAEWKQLTSLVQPLRRSLHKLGSVKGSRPWPQPYHASEDPTEDTELVLLIGIDEASALDTDPAYDEWLTEFTNKHCNELGSMHHLILINLEPVSDSLDAQGRKQRTLSTQLDELRPLNLEQLHERETERRRQSATLSAVQTGEQEDGRRRLCSAGETLSRLRWDPAHRSRSYEVGYLDRFDGLKWLSTTEWGKPVEDEGFIPEHRIQLFRQTTDGHVVWDRAKRLDLTGQS